LSVARAGGGHAFNEGIAMRTTLIVATASTPLFATASGSDVLAKVVLDCLTSL
jgi:hypothetical protein